jgi:hypothetical protein
MRTHSIKEVTEIDVPLHPCKIHGTQPKVFEMMVGRRRETLFVVNCQSDECGKIGDSVTSVVNSWNKWNP